MPRINTLVKEEMTTEQLRIHDQIVAGPRGKVRGPLAVWLHRPAMAEHAQALGQFCRYDSSLSPRISEWAILILARFWSSEFEWWAHKPIALKAGVSAEMIHALRDQKPINYENPDEKIVHQFLTELHENKRVSDAIYERAQSSLGKDGVIDLVALAGYYTLISMTLNVFEIEQPEGEIAEMRGDR